MNLLAEIRALSFADAKELVKETAYNLDITIPTLKSWEQLKDVINTIVQPVITEAREEKKAARKQARTEFMESVKIGDKFKLVNGDVVSVICKRQGNVSVKYISVVDEFQTMEVGDEMVMMVSSLMECERVNTTEYAIAILNDETNQYEIYADGLTDAQCHEKMLQVSDDVVSVAYPTNLKFSKHQVDRLQLLNDAHLEIVAKVNCINQVRSTCLEVHKILTTWLAHFKDDIKFKNDGSLHKKFADQIRTLLDDVEPQGYVTMYSDFKQGYSFRVEVRNHINIGESTFHHRESVYISNADLTECTLEQQSSFSSITPTDVIKLRKLNQELEQQKQDIRSKQSELKNRLAGLL